MRALPQGRVRERVERLVERVDLATDLIQPGSRVRHVVLFSGSTLIGPKIGPVKIYGALGVGNMWLNVQKASSILVPNPATLSHTYLTFNVGGGIATPLVPHFGIRGDLRYHRAFGFKLGRLAVKLHKTQRMNFNDTRLQLDLFTAARQIISALAIHFDG